MRAVIFDLDGVVVNTAKYHYLGWKKLAKELGFDFDISHNERLKGVSRMESLNIVLEVGGITGYSEEEKQKLADRKNRYYLEMIESIDGSEILPGIPEFLEKLKQKRTDDLRKAGLGFQIRCDCGWKSGGTAKTGPGGLRESGAAFGRSL